MSEAPQSYEVAVERLEEIIDRLDSGQAGLRETLDLCKEGRELVAYCAAELDAVGEGLKELRLDELAAKLEQGPSTDDSSAGQPLQRDRLRSSGAATGNSPAPDAGDDRGRSLAGGVHIGGAEDGGLWLVRALEEDVGDLDLRRAARLGDGQRVDRPLGLVAAWRVRPGRSRRAGRSCSRRPAAGARRARPAGRSSRAGRVPATPNRSGTSARTPAGSSSTRSRSRLEPSQPRTGSSSSSARVPESGSSPVGQGMAERHLRGRLAPVVRLAPLEQRVYGSAVRGALLPRRGRRRALLARCCALSLLPSPSTRSSRSGRGTPRRRRSPCRRAAGSAPPAARRSHQGRRPLAEWACGARRPAASRPARRPAPARARLTRTAISEVAKAASRPSRGCGGGTAIAESLSRSSSKPATIRSITDVPGFDLARAAA